VTATGRLPPLSSTGTPVLARGVAIVTTGGTVSTVTATDALALPVPDVASAVMVYRSSPGREAVVLHKPT
jgi:hypothetical protein